MSGSAPNSGTSSQMPTVRTKAWRTVKRSLAWFWQATEVSPPTTSAISAPSPKASALPLPCARSVSMGTSIVSPRTETTSPITYPTGRRSSMAASHAGGIGGCQARQKRGMRRISTARRPSRPMIIVTISAHFAVPGKSTKVPVRAIARPNP